MLWGAKGGRALLCLPQCIPRRICSQKKRPPGDLTRKPPQCPRPQRHTQDETAGTARCSGPTPPAVSLHPIRAPKTTCMTYGTKRSTTFGRGPAQSRESGLGVDQRPLACLSPSFSPHSPPSSSHSPFSCHGQKNSFLAHTQAQSRQRFSSSFHGHRANRGCPRPRPRPSTGTEPIEAVIVPPRDLTRPRHVLLSPRGKLSFLGGAGTNLVWARTPPSGADRDVSPGFLFRFTLPRPLWGVGRGDCEPPLWQATVVEPVPVPPASPISWGARCCRPKAPAPVPPASPICWVAPCCCPRGHLEGASQQTWHPTHPGISPWDTGAKSFCPLVPICTWTTWTCVCSGDSNHRGGCSCHRGGDASAPAPARETPLSRHFYRQFPGGNKKCRAPHGAKPSPAQGAARPSTNGELHLQRRQDAQPTVSPLARKNFCSHHFSFSVVWDLSF